jgi:hypothetical protein
MSFRAAGLMLSAIAVTTFTFGAHTQSVTRAMFDLLNQQTGVLKKGSSHITAVSACVGRVAKEKPYGTEALEIEFFMAPLTAADQADLATNFGRNVKKHDYAAFVIFLDTARHATQVNMTFVVPGSTVVQTVAYTATKITSDFSDLHFDGKRVRFKSKGMFDNLNAAKELLRLSRDVDLDLPVVERNNAGR